MHKRNIFFLMGLVGLWFILSLGCAQVEITSALIYLSQPGSTDKAMKQLEIALAKDSTNADAHLLMGVCYGNLKQFSRMNDEFDIVTRLSASSKIDSQKFADRIMGFRDDFWQQYFDIGLELISSKMMANAEIAFWNCTLIDSTRPEAYINLAIIEEENDNFEASLKHYEIAFKNNKENVDLAFYIASLYSRGKKYDKLLDIMDQLLKIEPKNSEALAQKAIAHDCLGDIEQAISSYEKAIVYLPNDSELLYNLGRLHFLNEHYENAVAVLNKVWELDSTDVQTSYLLGISSLNLGEIALQQMSENDSLASCVDVQTDSILVERATSHFTDSVYFLKKSAQMDPGNADVWNHLGVAYLYIGAKREAEEAFAREKALEKN
ncbi:MAG: tetratricopeptide repeat protein [Candidatus Zhuqueibacterota bacterium]